MKPGLLASTHRKSAAGGVALAAIVTTGCASSATVESAPYAHDPACAEVMLALPEEIGEFSQRPTTSQGTSVWGSPAAIVLRCGVEPMGPTSDPCVSPAGIDWVWTEDDGDIRLHSYGREPAVEVLLDAQRLSEDTTMNAQFALVEPVSRVEQTRECTSITDTEDAQES